MKNKFIIPIILILVLITTVIGASPSVAPVPMLTSADQYYSVVFDGEGDAIVTLKLVIRNQDTTPISNINLEIPGKTVTVFGVLQETNGYETKVCNNWVNGCLEYGSGQTCVQYDFNGNCQKSEAPCLRQGTVCSSYSTSYNYQQLYQKITPVVSKLSNSVALSLDLLSSVQQNGETNLLIMYKVKDYTSNVLGATHFDFETLKTAFTTTNARVAVNVQSDLYLKGGPSKINFQPDFMIASGAMQSMDKMVAERPNDIQNYARQIIYAQGYVKTATYLDPYESLTVKGDYSSSWFSLYWLNAVGIAFCISIVVVALTYGVKRLKKHIKESIPEKVALKQSEQKHKFTIPFLTGLFTAIAIGLTWVVAIVVISGFGRYLNYSINQMFGLLIVLFALLVTLALLIGIPIYIGSKYGPVFAGFTVLSIFGWLFIFAVMTVIILSFFSVSYSRIMT